MASTLTLQQLEWTQHFTGLSLTANGQGNGAAGPAKTGPAGGTSPDADALKQEVATLEKLASVWHAVESRVESDIGKLRDALTNFFDGDPAQSSMEKEFEGHVEKIFGTFDTTLARDLRDAAKSPSMQALTLVKTDLRKAVDDCLASIGADKTIALFDENPYVPLALRATCERALRDMAKHLA